MALLALLVLLWAAPGAYAIAPTQLLQVLGQG
jgi:hypothetical protein